MLHELRISPEATGTWDIFAREVSKQIPTMKDGLYVFFLTNELPAAVRDNNIGREKVVIHPSGASLKPGKFEGGFNRRLRDYQEHLHWVDDQGEKNWVFTRCFRFGLLLDLSRCDLGFRSSARVFEQYWIESANTFLDREGLWAPVRQLARSEWNYIQPHAWSTEVEHRFVAFMRDRAERIMKMAEVASPADAISEAHATDKLSNRGSGLDVL